jgi:hypothetical protein
MAAFIALLIIIAVFPAIRSEDQKCYLVLENKKDCHYYDFSQKNCLMSDVSKCPPPQIVRGWVENCPVPRCDPVCPVPSAPTPCPLKNCPAPTPCPTCPPPAPPTTSSTTTTTTSTTTTKHYGGHFYNETMRDKFCEDKTICGVMA